tara:strand:- start:740 stop:955 length:216 start_codon:yes stop_codon:yes gene_type:complete
LRIIIVAESIAIHFALNVIMGEINMKLKKRLMKLYKDVSKKALREPRTMKELAMRKKYDRLKTIMGKRYDL